MKIRISSPCPESWAAMKGDDRVRFCMKCKLDVYNLQGMAPHEIEALVRRKSGNLCGRLYQRGDGTASFLDCGRGRARRLKRGLAAVGAFLLLAGFSWLLRSAIREPDRSVHPKWVRVVLDWISPEERGVLMGKIAPPPPPPPPGW